MTLIFWWCHQRLLVSCEFYLRWLFSCVLIFESCRRVSLFRQHIRYREQHHLLCLQCRYVLSGRRGYADALPRWVFLSGRPRGLGCATPRVSCGVVLQRQRIGSRRALSSGLVVSHSRPVVGAATMSDRISLSHGRLGCWCTVSAGSILSRGWSGDGRVVSVGLVQLRGRHELFFGMLSVCAGFVGVA
jgi:hypothetical protein